MIIGLTSWNKSNPNIRLGKVCVLVILVQLCILCSPHEHAIENLRIIILGFGLKS